MPKLKTHKGLAKRVRVSPNGKIKRKKAFAGHLMSGKTGNRKRVYPGVVKWMRKSIVKIVEYAHEHF